MCAVSESWFLSRLVLYVLSFIVTDHLINKQEIVQTSSNEQAFIQLLRNLQMGMWTTLFQRDFPNEK